MYLISKLNYHLRIINKSNVGMFVSLLYPGINIGFSVGPILAAFLYRNYFSLTFIGNSVAILITLLLVIFFVDETKPNNLEEEAMTTLIVYLTKKNKPLFNIALSGVFFAVSFGMNFLIKVYPLFIITTIVWTIGEIVNATNMGVYIADHAPSSHRGRFNSVLNIITGAGSAIGPLIMGRYIENLGVKFVWPLVFSVTMISALMIYLLHLRENRQHKVNLE